MASNWRILDFSSFKGELSFNQKTKRLKVVGLDTGEYSEHALDEVNIIFIGIYVVLAPAVMYHLAKRDVVVILCDWKGLPVSSVYPWIDAHGRIAARQRAQAGLTKPRSKNAWMRIVKAKIRGQANNLDYLKRDGGEKLNELAASVRSGDVTNIEAQAARYYWSQLYSGEGFKRIPGEVFDARNACLDYGYTILRGHSMRAVLSAGLTPALGLYHKSRSNAFALADDLIEVFRPAIDYSAALLDKNATPDNSAIKKVLLQATLQTFSSDGSTIPTVMIDFAQQFGRYCEGDLNTLDTPLWNPQVYLKDIQ